MVECPVGMGACRGQEMLEFPEIELQAVVNGLTWMLGAQFRTSGGTRSRLRL